MNLSSSPFRNPYPKFLAAGLLFSASLAAQVNVLTANYDNQRTNANLQETILNQQNVTTGSFGKIGYFPVDGEIYAQPLYASGVQITGQGPHNVVFVVTMHNSVYAIDADMPGSTTPLWTVNFGPSVPSWVLNFTDILPEVGILSTPVIDLARQVIYIVSDTLEGGMPVLSVSERIYRITGLLLLLLCVCKIVLRDAWRLTERDRYITFI